MIPIANKKLLRQSAFINGQWINDSIGAIHSKQSADKSPSDRTTFPVHNPCNNQVIADVYETSSEEVQSAIQAASNMLAPWQMMSYDERAAYLIKWRDLVLDNLDDLAHLVTLEQGKPTAEAKGEIQYAADYIQGYCQQASLFENETLSSATDQDAVVKKVPVGVVAAITPWNFPCAMIIRKAAAALAAGCTVVIKPSELTPLTALALIELSLQAGFPPGVINLVVGSNAAAIGEAFCLSDDIAKISFTGSTRVGKKLLSLCAQNIKRVALELGGNAPFIVYDDADLDLAVDAAINNKFRNAGQTCVTANRFLIQSTIAPQFTQKLLNKMKNLVCGSGFSNTSTIGPMINSASLEKIQRLLDESEKMGARCLLGGSVINQTFFEPTLIDKITEQMPLFNQEIFGPVAAITVFDTVEESLHLANKTRHGLVGYVFSRNRTTIELAERAINVGMLGINEARLSNTEAPFGGVKQSGMGREGGRYGIGEYLETKYICRKT